MNEVTVEHIYKVKHLEASYSSSDRECIKIFNYMLLFFSPHVLYLMRQVFFSSTSLRPYYVESTGSRPITEVKQRRARSVLGWVTAWEHRVL